MRKGVLFLLILVSSLSTRANNVQLQGTVKVVSATGSLVTMEVDLSWDNSWRDDYNWDATWLFFKYKVGVDGAWQHAAINATMATVTGGDYTTMSATTAATAQGLFVYPSKDRAGKTGNLKVQVQWAAPHTKAQFDNNDIFVVAHGIEMVYVPYGAYTIGDGSSMGSFPKQVIDSEAVFGTANAAYPKGYQGFYVMKYETSQEQYVEFLNTLTLAQQKALIPGVESLSVGNFVFGSNKTAPNYRNSVILSGKIAGKPLFFDNNLNNNKVYSEDGDGGTLAMNYMSITDACGYASWAGLRPMTEMEYEKACRRPYPQEPEAGEYAWNSAVGAVNATGLTLQGSGREIAATGNVNAGGTINGPVRCGIFARPTTANQAAAGATYWGVMEMSGNVSELCANITNPTISKTGNGTGVYNASLFGAVPNSYGTRGGGFRNTHNTLTTSSRAAVSCFTNALQRDSTVGFRCVFTYDAAGAVSPGTIVEDKQPCPGVSVTFSGTPATAGAVKITGYIWSIKIGTGAFTVIPGESGAMLTYSDFAANTTYQFKRKAICPLGEAEVSTKRYTTPNTTLTLSPVSAMLDACGGSSEITATSAGSVYSWSYSGTPLGTGATYTPSRSDFLSQSGTFEVLCTTTVSGCVGSAKLTVEVQAITIVNSTDVTLANCEKVSFTDSRDGKVYCTRKIGNQCWMGVDLKFGTCNASTFNTYFETSVQNQIAPNYYGVCIASPQPGAGNLYNWQGAMNKSDAYNGQNTSGVTAQWQGICPAGWYLPATGEFTTMYNALGNVVSKVYPGLGAGEFRGVLGGYGLGATVDNAGSNGYYWGAPAIDSGGAYSLNFSTGYVGPQHYDYKSSGLSVRCLKK